jgi:NodT family efflux transporter outer membrane factor (OMF) lipoprotein
MRRTAFPLVLPAALAIVAAACSVGPDYVRPTADVPPAYRENDGWKTAEPHDAAERGAWWEVFDDPALNALEAQVVPANQNVAAAEARFLQARAIVSETRAAWFPTVTIGVSATRLRTSENSGFVSASGGGTSFAGGGRTSNDFAMPITVAWEADLWGRIRRAVQASEATAQASAGDLAGAELSLEGEVATNYFRARTLDAEAKLFAETIVAFAKSLELTQNRYNQGVASLADVAQAQTQLESTRAQAIDLGVERAQVEHAIAVLIGKPPADFSLPTQPLDRPPPAIPAGVPSALLERRPDIAAAERRAAATSADIGVAVAAYYPTLTLSATGGFTSSDIANWLTWPSRVWSFGPSLTETVFDGGARGAETTRARAAWDEAVANYRQSTLSAFQEVEDDLAALRILEEEAEVQDRAVAAAREAVRIVSNQYKAGITSYIEVVLTQASALANERAARDVLGRRLASAVQLVQALGGGWNASDLPPTSDLATGIF